MGVKWILLFVLMLGPKLNAQKQCPIPKAIMPCRCQMRGEEYQIWCTHSDLSSVLEGLKATAKFIHDPIDEVILENNYLPSLPGRTFFPLKILRLMLRYNGLERVSNDWLGGLQTSLMELFVVEPKLRSIPEDSLLQFIALQAVTIQSKLMKRIPLFSGLPKLRYLQLESTALLELSPLNFKDNPSLEKLLIGDCPRLNRLEANLFRDLPSLKLLNISYCGLTWMHHRALTRLPVLQELVLIGNRFSDAGMVGRASRDLPQLGVLRLDDNYIETLGEASFVDLPSLHTLHISRNRISELHHGAFHRVPRLRKLDLQDNMLRRVHPESFLQESGLEELWLVRNEISHVADLRAILDALPRLVFLDMSYNRLEAIPFGSLRDHPNLEHLHLDHNRIHLIDREAFVAMPALRELRLKNNSLSDSLQPPLWNLPNLKGLDLSENFLRRLGPNFLQDLPSLRKVDLSRNGLEFVDPSAFARTPSLEHVNISFNSLPTLHPATFRPLPGLYELDISSNLLVEFVPGLPRGLEYLHLKNNDISAFPLATDLDLPMLRMLDLSGNKIEALPKEGFTALPQLRKLHLARNFLKKLEDESLKGLTKLEMLDLAENGIASLGHRAFRHQAELRDLNLGDNKLEVLMPECFQHSPRLKRLNLTRNMIVEIVPGTLNKNKDLQMIDISHNRLVKLSSAFMGLKNLRVLEATHNRLDAIEPEIMGTLPSLTELKLSHNYIKELRENGFNKLQYLTSLDLEENDLELIEPGAVKTLPALKRIKLNRNKLKEIPNGAFVNLPALHLVELQENQLKSIGPNAFTSVPHLLMLNLSHNQLSSLENAGLRGVRSLELLDVSGNLIKSLASPVLQRMEWLVELRLDQNEICSVQGSPFNSMPRLRVLSMRGNKLMSFSERAVERIRSNIALLDIDGNPLACSCNMLWLQVWLQETSSMGPKCADGYLLRELEELRRECPEDERNVELVAPGCEAELLTAPGVYGTSQVQNQWMNLKASNGSKERNNVAPSPQESDYFYDEYVDLTDMATTGLPMTTKSPHFTSGDTPTIYASPKTKNKPTEKDIPKQINNSPSSSGFTFLGLPLPNFVNLISNAVKPRKDDSGVPTDKTNERMAIVNMPTRIPSNPSMPRMYSAPPNSPKIETGGFVPILPGSGGFKPIANPITEATTSVLISTTEQISSTPYLDTTINPIPTTVIVEEPTSDKSEIVNIKIAPEPSSTNNPENITTEPNPETTPSISTENPSTETTTLKIQTTVLKPVKNYKVETTHTSFEREIRHKSTAILAEAQPPKKLATITKVPAPHLPSASAPLKSGYDALPPMAHNREPKQFPPKTVGELEKSDMSWYFATYNNTKAQAPNKCASTMYILLIWVLRACFD